MYKKNQKITVCLLSVIVLAFLTAGIAMANPFKGNGKTTTKKFKIPAGVYLFEVDHKGFSKYEFYFKSQDGSKVKLLAKGTGPYKGIAVVGVEPEAKPKGNKDNKNEGKYYIAANTDGPWQVSIMSCRKEADGRSFEGETDTRDATPVFKLKKGKYTFSVKHQGGRQFQAILMNGYGRKVAVLAQGIGKINTKQKMVIPKDGEYIVDITASGKWNLEIFEMAK